MPRSVTFFKGWLLGAAVAFAIAAPSLLAVTYSTREEALAKAFPGADVERQTLTLSEEQRQRASDVAGGRPIESASVIRYVARSNGSVVGWAYFDTHRIHSQTETLMILLHPDGRSRRVEVIEFNEPRKYQASESWLAQFADRKLDEDLWIRRGVDGITGATLTARAVTRAVRRAMAVHNELETAAP